MEKPDLAFPVTNISYSVDGYSSFSGAYHPDNIQENSPADQSSRWSSASNNQLQFLILKLNDPAIVKNITFGKYEKAHVCNLKELKVYGGMEKDNMTEILHCGLQNDSQIETFQVTYRRNNLMLPSQFIKIIPIAAFGANFNFSIWHVSLSGITDQSAVNLAVEKYSASREDRAVRLCMKYLRQHGFTKAFESLSAETSVRLEHPIITKLHQELVINGNFHETEKILTQMERDGMFNNAVHDEPFKAEWTRIKNETEPGPRGGHQMIIDNKSRRIVLFGGWDGKKDLADLWEYSLEKHEWRCICHDTSIVDGPSPRSCHKMCLDPDNGLIYTLGRYVERRERDEKSPIFGDFYSYDLAEGKWTLISSDTEKQGGPPLVYDHQLCIDSEKKVLYFFGGRIISRTDDKNGPFYCGLYRYDLIGKSWTKLLDDYVPPNDTTTPISIGLKSRIGHSMVFDKKTRNLIIFAGQRFKEYLSDFYLYNVDTGLIETLSTDTSRQGGPDAGFTQRVTIDSDSCQIFVLSGLMREDHTTSETVSNCFWVYRLDTRKWQKAYSNLNRDPSDWEAKEPRPRFAHQLVFDPIEGSHYVFGGNPGYQLDLELRLDDFWRLRLRKEGSEVMLRRALHLVRKQCFIEMCASGDTMKAIMYLRDEISNTVDHSNELEEEEFKVLSVELFKQKNDDCRSYRMSVYQAILQLLPESETEPRVSIVDFIYPS